MKPMREWYVLHVMTGKETDTKAVIKRDIPDITATVPEEEIVTMAPQRRLMERKNGKWKIVIKNVFPGYVFIRAEMSAELYYKLTGIPSVIRILGANGPHPVPPDEMQTILWLTNDGDVLDISEVTMTEGSKIKVIAGPLVGLEGNIVKIDARRHRAKVQLVLMGEQRIVELGINLLKSEGAP